MQSVEEKMDFEIILEGIDRSWWLTQCLVKRLGKSWRMLNFLLGNCADGDIINRQERECKIFH